MLNPESLAGQNHKQRVDNSGGPHAEQDRESQTANSKEIDHQIDPKGPCKPHLGEDTKRRYEHGNDDSKDIAASHGRSRQCPCFSNHQPTETDFTADWLLALLSMPERR